MKEDFVTYGLAVKLKEKGYPQVKIGTLAMYNEDGEWFSLAATLDTFEYSFEDFDDRDCVCPTISQVLKWLREEKNLSIEPYSCACGWRVTICKTGNVLEGYVSGGTCVKDGVKGNNDGGAFNFYEEAALAGIEYVIDNLI